MSPHRDMNNLRSPLPKPQKLTQAGIDQARKVVCGNAADTEEAIMFLEMLGIGKQEK